MPQLRHELPHSLYATLCRIVNAARVEMMNESECVMTSPNSYFGGPTKDFFVSMLTRDIALNDAILDLVDNSVDGAMRSRQARRGAADMYDGCKCNLTISRDRFEISDNCGGIPKAYLENAFRLGRPKIDLDNGIPTIGVYGIGMKRAIFKIANDATVDSHSNDASVRVTYTGAWMSSETDWELPFTALEPSETLGVAISATSIRPEIAKTFSDPAFIDRLEGQIGEHFAYLMKMGFEIVLNGKTVAPRIVQVIDGGVGSIRPYDYEGLWEGVKLKVTIGFYRKLTREAELEEATQERDQAVDKAGITIICNERVILHSDKSSQTGWGVASTPRYHPQFRAISGIVSFECDDASKLPVSTTKRDVDHSSAVYLKALNRCIDGIQIFTSFTNRWKGRETETDQYVNNEQFTSARTVALASTEGMVVRGTGGAEKVYSPDLPKPPNKSTLKRIAFTREVEEIEALGSALLDNPRALPSDVGVASWLRVLKEVTRS